MTLFVLQNNRMEHLVYPVLDFCKANGFQFLDRSMTDELDFDKLDYLEFGGTEQAMIVYGSVGWCIRASESEALGQYVWNHTEVFEADYWLKRLGENYLNHDGVLVRADLVAEAIDSIYHLSGKYHLRPNNEDKAFLGAVYDKESWLKHKEERNVKDWLKVMMSPVKKINAEYRSWVIDGRIVEISQYRLNDVHDRQHIVDPALFAVAQGLAEQMHTDHPYVLDFAATDDGYKLIETNPLHASGWYAADVANVLNEWIKYANKQR
ncbi:hypothetical protein D3C87_666340 [compost metagenome]